MIKDSINNVKHIFNELLDELTGGAKRRAAAMLAKEYGPGGQSYVAKEFNISRDTIRKGTIEIESNENVGTTVTVNLPFI